LGPGEGKTADSGLKRREACAFSTETLALFICFADRLRGMLTAIDERWVTSLTG